MKIYLSKTVWDATLDRIRWIFDEFPNVIAGVSGGKDSTVIYHLCLKVAREKGRLPLKVMFLDQEAEWQSTVDIIRKWMYHPDVEPKWYQMPIRLFNATSTFEHWLHCWDPAEKENWIHPQDPISIKENIYGTDRFAECFRAITIKEYPNLPTCYLSGVRTEESPSRYMGLTHYLTYKDITWGSVLNKKNDHYTFYPIYDWSYIDVWKAIHDNQWEYNQIYDKQWAYGLPIQRLRVSNVHHETAVFSLFYLQELEPDTYIKLVKRLKGIDMAGKMGKNDYFVYDLPFMFTDWREYRDYLLDNLISDPNWKTNFKKVFTKHEKLYLPELSLETLCKVHIQSILTNDWEGITLENFERNPTIAIIREKKRQTKSKKIRGKI